MGFASLDATVLSGVGTAWLAHIPLISRLKEMVRWLRPNPQLAFSALTPSAWETFR